MSTIREFALGIKASVSTVENKDVHLPVDEKGILAGVPKTVKGFHLFIGLPKNIWAFVVQKNVGMELGGYSTDSLTDIGRGGNVHWTALATPIEVKRAGHNVWTNWHTDIPNRVDVWLIDSDGRLVLYQIGVITHDDGKSWRLHGEVRWVGRLFTKDGELVACPDEPRVKWGPFKTWKGIFENDQFRKLVAVATIKEWAGKREDLEPPYPPIEGNGKYAKIQYYVSFAGQTGQGYVWLDNNERNNGTVHGMDLCVPPDDDGVKRLHRGDIVSYKDLVYGWGSKKDGPPKLTGVRLVSRTW